VRRVCVFCGSSPGSDPAYLEAARGLGATLGHRGLSLVYGGASVGLMGAVADAALAAGAHVTGVIPSSMVTREIAHPALHDLRVVATMHERKALMADLADAFVALPGGIGTLDETFEILTWAQLGLHGKPVGFLNVAGFYDPLVAFLERGIAERFIRAEHRGLFVMAGTAEDLIDRLARYAAPAVEKWLDRAGA
jgi:hypothetical protein